MLDWPPMNEINRHFSLGNAISAEAQHWVGSKARTYTSPEKGMDTEGGFDCSGFTRFVLERVFNAAQIQFPKNIRHTNEFLDQFGKLISLGLQQPGDLAVFPDENGIFPKHIGIVVGLGSFVEAKPECPGKVVLSKLDIRRLDRVVPEAAYNTSPITFKRPAVKLGRWQIDNVRLSDILEVNMIKNMTSIDTENIEELDCILNVIREGNPIRRNLEQLRNLAYRRRFACVQP